MTADKYMRWDAAGVEHGAGAEEDALIAEVCAQINESQTRVRDAHHHAFTGTHVKTHGVVKGSLEVLPNLPAHLAQSMFAKQATYPVAIRFSSEPTDLVPDTQRAPRGMAIKVFNVDGEKLRQDGKDPRTQDLEFNNAPAIELGNARVTRDIIGLRLKHSDDASALQAELKKRDDYAVQKARDEIPNTPLVAHRQYSQAAMRFGDYVAKLALVPVGDTQKALEAKELPEETNEKTGLRQNLEQFLQQNTATWELQAQLLEDLEQQAVEDARVEWPQDKFPYQTIARLSVPPQECFLPQRVNFWRDQMRLDPWYGLASLQPLGSVNRLRKGVYAASSAHRRRLNGGVRVVSVASLDELPDE